MCSSNTELRWDIFPSAFCSIAVSDSISSEYGSKLTSLTDGVSEGEFEVIINEELDSIRSISCFPGSFSSTPLTTPFLSDPRGLHYLGLRPENHAHRRWQVSQGRVLPQVRRRSQRQLPCRNCSRHDSCQSSGLGLLPIRPRGAARHEQARTLQRPPR